MFRKIAIPSILPILLVGTLTIVWAGLNWPPPFWILKYGVHPGCRPTGKVVKVVGIEFVMIGPGIRRIGSDYLPAHPKDKWFHPFGFTMGNALGRLCHATGLPWGKALRPSWEMPVHWVQFPHGFGIAKTEITNIEYERFDEKHHRDRYSNGDRGPVEQVSWDDAQRYCAWLSKKSGRKVRLPSESEWECACRAGTRTEYERGANESGLEGYAWYEESFTGRTHEVGRKRANAWGLFDMEGNVSEWCVDRWHDSYLVTRKVKEKDGTVAAELVDRPPDDGSAWERGGSPRRVVRNGTCLALAVWCRSAFRFGVPHSARSSGVGFRVSLDTQ